MPEPSSADHDFVMTLLYALAAAIVALSGFVVKVIFRAFKMTTDHLEARKDDAVRDEQNTSAIKGLTKAVERVDSNVEAIKDSITRRPESER